MTDPDPTDAPEAAERAFARNLFAPEAEADDAEPDDDTEPQHGNVVPLEGTIPTERPDEERAAVRAIFGYDPA